jgi:hypothetical protein
MERRIRTGAKREPMGEWYSAARYYTLKMGATGSSKTLVNISLHGVTTLKTVMF